MHAFDLISTLQLHQNEETTSLLPRVSSETVDIRSRKLELSESFNEELAYWIHLATRGSWSETDEDFVGGLVENPFINATRKVLDTLHSQGLVDITSLPTIAFAFQKN